MGRRLLALLVFALMLVPVVPVVVEPQAQATVIHERVHYGARWLFYSDGSVVIEYNGANTTLWMPIGRNPNTQAVIVYSDQQKVIVKVSVSVGQFQATVYNTFIYSPYMPQVKIRSDIESSAPLNGRAFEYRVTFPKAPGKHGRHAWAGGAFWFSTADLAKAGVKHSARVQGSTLVVQVNLTGTTVTLDPAIGYVSGTENRTVWMLRAPEIVSYQNDADAVSGTKYSDTTVWPGDPYTRWAEGLCSASTPNDAATLAQEKCWKDSTSTAGWFWYILEWRNVTGWTGEFRFRFRAGSQYEVLAWNWATGVWDTIASGTASGWVSKTIAMDPGTYLSSDGSVKIAVRGYYASAYIFMLDEAVLVEAHVNAETYYEAYSDSNATYSYRIPDSTPEGFNASDCRARLPVPDGYDLTANTTSYTIVDINSTHYAVEFTVPAGGAVFNFTAWNSIGTLALDAEYYPLGGKVNVTVRLLDPYGNPIPGENVTIWISAGYKHNQTTLTLANATIAPGDTIAPHLYDWKLDGTDDYITFAAFSDRPDVLISTVKTYIETEQTLIGGAFARFKPYDEFRYELYPYESGIYFFIRYINKTDGTQVTSPINPKPGSLVGWHTIEVRLENATMSVIVDGSILASKTLPDYGGLWTGSDTIVIGEYSATYFKGKISYLTFKTDQNNLLIADPTFYNGTHYIDLASGLVGTPYGGVKRVPANETWLWLVKGLQSDGFVHLEWFPIGSIVRFRDPSTGQVVREVVIGSNDELVDIPAGTYTVEAIIPEQANYTSVTVTTDANGYASVLLDAPNYDADLVIQAEYNGTYAGVRNATAKASGVETSLSWGIPGNYTHSYGELVDPKPSAGAWYTVDGSPAPYTLVYDRAPVGALGPWALNATLYLGDWGTRTYTGQFNLTVTVGVFTLWSPEPRNLTLAEYRQGTIDVLRVEVTNTTLYIQAPGGYAKVPTEVRLDGARVDGWTWDPGRRLLVIRVPGTLVEVYWAQAPGGGGASYGGVPAAVAAAARGGGVPEAPSGAYVPAEFLAFIAGTILLAAAVGSWRRSGKRPVHSLKRIDYDRLRERVRRAWRRLG